jgi:hypothetical protein
MPANIGFTWGDTAAGIVDNTGYKRHGQQTDRKAVPTYEKMTDSFPEKDNYMGQYFSKVLFHHIHLLGWYYSKEWE